MFSLIVAYDENNAIGFKNKLLWNLPKDLKHFKNYTLNKNIIMGRKTFESIGFALPKRNNIILTKNIKFKDKNCSIFNNVNDILKLEKKYPHKEFCIIGGGEIYKMFLPLCKKLIITKVHTKIKDKDTFFPKINNKIFKLQENKFYKKDNENNLDFSIEIYDNFLL